MADRETHIKTQTDTRCASSSLSDLGPLLELWRAAQESSDPYLLATVVAVEGSSYRKPGARMLLTKSGRRAGTISGGCLEAEVTRKAWWLTESGATVQRYSTFFDVDGDIPYGLGCGGTVHVLLERAASAGPILELLEQLFASRLPCSVATVISGTSIAKRSLPGSVGEPAELAASATAGGCSAWQRVELNGEEVEVFAEFLAPRPGLFLFGAGDDAIPLADLAHTQGWHVVVADARSNLPTRARFRMADEIVTLTATSLGELQLRPTDAAVLITHSYEQDRRLLAHLLPMSLRYLGVLGPRRRTEQLVSEIAPELGLTPEACMARLKAPVGLNIGAENPASIALSIVAEIEMLSHERTKPTASVEGDAVPAARNATMHA